MSVGGLIVSVKLISEHLNSDLYESVIIHDNNEVSYKDNKGSLIRSFTVPFIRAINPIKDLITLIKVYKIIKAEKPDLIHCHSAKAGIIGRIIGKLTNVPTLYTPQAFSFLSSNSNLKRRIFLAIEKLCKFNNSLLLACSNSEYKRGVEEVNYKQHQVRLWNNSLPPAKEVNGQPSINIPKQYICALSRPSYQKNVEMLIEVMKILQPLLPELKLLIVGAGYHSPNKKSVETLIEKYNLSQNIILIPWIERTEALKIIKNADCVVSSSRYEGLPFAIIEALSLAKACVVTKVDGNQDLINNAVNGYTVELDDVKDMSEKIHTIITDPSLRTSFEQKSFTIFNEKFNINNTVTQLEEIYSSHINSGL